MRAVTVIAMVIFIAAICRVQASPFCARAQSPPDVEDEQEFDIPEYEGTVVNNQNNQGIVMEAETDNESSEDQNPRPEESLRQSQQRTLPYRSCHRRRGRVVCTCRRN